MKNWSKLLIFLMLLGLSFSSCTKEDLECNHEEEQVDGMDLRFGEDDGDLGHDDDGDGSGDEGPVDGEDDGVTDDDDEDDDDELEDEEKG